MTTKSSSTAKQTAQAAEAAAEAAKQAAQAAAQAAAEIVKAAATAAAEVASSAAQAAALVGSDISYIKKDLGEIKANIREIKDDYVTHREFTESILQIKTTFAENIATVKASIDPIKKVLYLVASTIGLAILVAALKLVIR